MGVDVLGFSRVRAEAVPECYLRFDPASGRLGPNEAGELWAARLRAEAARADADEYGERAAARAAKAADEAAAAEAAAARARARAGELVCVDWERGVYFVRTVETQQHHAMCSYGGFNALHKDMERALGRPLRFRVPDTDTPPWHGLFRCNLVELAHEDCAAALPLLPGHAYFAEDYLRCLALARDRGVLRVC